MFNRIVSGAARVLPDLLRDVLALVAAGLIAYGAWLIYEPAGYITAGLLLLVALYLQTQGSRSLATGG